MAKLVSKVYGDALFEDGHGKRTPLYEEVNALRTIFKDNPDLAAVF